ncbi:serine hydrolase [Arthrobacter sp. NPDC097144]|uniref:serine hydrolase n=1 Tax=Arthrobacter sp. NPDC097144 TaxID=3363946 RepID=UPI0037FEAEE8
MAELRAVPSLKQCLLIGEDQDEIRWVKPESCADSPFEWASITKTLTASIARRLALEDAIDLVLPVAAQSSRLAEAPAWVTPMSLLCHTSGLPRMPEGMNDRKDPYKGMTRERLADQLPSVWAAVDGPGDPASVSYSNLGYALLTLLLEEASGSDWSDLAATQLKSMGISEGVYVSPPEGGLVLKSVLGRKRLPWSLGDGAFIGAGGLWGTLDALAAYGQASRTWWKSNSVEGLPLGWLSSDGYWSHTGGSRDTSAILVFNDNLVLAASTIGFGPFESEKIARKALGR